MNPYLTEEGSKMIFSQDLAKIFPWLEGYDLTEDSKNALIFKSYRKALDEAEETFDHPGRLLDIGCGSGHFLKMGKERGWQTEGLDFTSENSQKIKTQFQIDVHVGKLSETHLPAESYDLLTMWDYFEHVEEPIQILKTARRLLKPGGMLVLACPNHDGLIFFAARWLFRLSGGLFKKPLPMLYPPTHLSYFSPKFLAKQVKQHGFRVLKIDYDETDLNRIHISDFLKFILHFVFSAARNLGLSNRFTLYLQKAVG